jgi:hypothetical protein
MQTEAFNFAFTLFGLLLGLSLAELFGGFARALRARHRIHMGWLSPLLGLLLAIDLVTFWTQTWDLRDSIPVTLPTLLFGALIAGLYYIAAALVFPDDLQESSDLDAYYFRQKVWVILAVQVSNLLLVAAMLFIYGNFFTSPAAFGRLGLWVGAGLLLILVRPKWLNVVALIGYLQLYWATRLLF